MYEISIITLGCKQNKYESDCMARILEKEYSVFTKLQFADVYIINTCAVTAEAEKKSRQYIAKCNKLNPKCKIIICGCASQNNIDQFRDKDNVVYVFGTEGKENILEYVKQAFANNIVYEKEELPLEYRSITNPNKTTVRENLKIQDGCNNFCTYCVIPYLRGRSRSRDIDDIISEAHMMASRTREIVLTGIDISSYKVNDELALPKLMARLSDVDANISLGSLEQGVITEDLMKDLKSMPNFVPHFHLSLQSGDNEILKKMNRHYTADEFYQKVNLIRKYFPLANITTDVIVGFAGETEEQFANTKSFVSKCEFSFVHIFPYSKREGTIAYNFPDLDKEIKRKRVDELEAVNKELQYKYLSQFIGKESLFLPEEKKDYWEGFSLEHIRCYSDKKFMIVDSNSNNFYKVVFREIYEDGLFVDVIGTDNEIANIEFKKLNNIK